jgi:hypothetical protein
VLPLLELLELFEEHPAAVMDAAATSPQAASHRCLLSVIAMASVHQRHAISRERLIYTPITNAGDEALAFGICSEGVQLKYR